MKNTYKLIWSDEALINDNPFLFAESDKSNGLRKSVLSRQTTIYYRIVDYEIHIITLFDNRQNPNKLRKK